MSPSVLSSLRRAASPATKTECSLRERALATPAADSFERRRREAGIVSVGPDPRRSASRDAYIRIAKEAVPTTSFALSPLLHHHIDGITVAASNASEPTVSSAAVVASGYFKTRVNGTATQHALHGQRARHRADAGDISAVRHLSAR